MPETAEDPPEKEHHMRVQHHARDRREERMESARAGVLVPSRDDARERARSLAVLGAEAIRRALSDNSTRFLSRNRQEVGE